MFSSGNDEGRERGDLYGVKLCAAVQGAENYFEYLGRRYHWSYNEQDNLLKCFQDIYTDSLRKYLENNVLQLDPELVEVFTRDYRRIVTDKQPTAYCPIICKDNTCQYRHILATQLEDVYYHNAFVETINKGGPDLYENLKTICIQAAEELNPVLIPDTQRKIALCFALHKTMELENFSQRHFDILMSNLLELVEETITMS